MHNTIKRVYKEIKQKLASLPNGESQKSYLLINGSKKHPEYYEVDKETKKRTYLPKSNMARIKELAQATYEEKFRKEAQAQIKELEDCIRKLEGGHDVRDVYNNLSPEMKALVTPIDPDEEFARIWQNTPFTSKVKPPKKILKTDRGEYVRSKTEQLIANKLYALGIPYHYEKPIFIKSKGEYYYPDFTILNKRTRKVYLWEHMGLLADEEYRVKNLTKIDDYVTKGYVVGKNFVVTFESYDKTIATETIDAIIRANFL